ncbi:COG1361 family protein [Streptomyces alboflavus]|uniref:hypothetical protein n=1 Tax=Streptomyces alboflavus TaxID=67267 RepID=UPI003695E073
MRENRMRLRYTLSAATGALLLTTLLAPTASAGASVGSAKLLNSDLEAVRAEPDPTEPGGSTLLRATVVNHGPDTTGGPFTLTVRLPLGAEAEEPFFPDTCRLAILSSGHTVRCTFPRGLPANASVTADIPVRISPNAPVGDLEGGSTQATALLYDRNPSNNRAPFTLRVVEA